MVFLIPWTMDQPIIRSLAATRPSLSLPLGNKDGSSSWHRCWLFFFRLTKEVGFTDLCFHKNGHVRERRHTSWIKLTNICFKWVETETMKPSKKESNEIYYIFVYECSTIFFESIFATSKKTDIWNVLHLYLCRFIFWFFLYMYASIYIYIYLFYLFCIDYFNIYRYTNMEPVWFLSWRLNPPNEILFQSKQGSCGFQAQVTNMCIYIYRYLPRTHTHTLQVRFIDMVSGWWEYSLFIQFD